MKFITRCIVENEDRLILSVDIVSVITRLLLNICTQFGTD